MSTTLLDSEKSEATANDAATEHRSAGSTIGIVGKSLLRLAGEVETHDEADSSAEIPNRRKLPRRLGMYSARVGLCPDGVPAGSPQREWLLAGTPIYGDLQDVTLESAAFELKNKLADGARVLLRLENREQGARVDAVGEVQRTSNRDGRYLTVCRLHPALRFEDVEALGWLPFPADVV